LVERHSVKGNLALD